jgi:hypothetical protein
VIVAGFACVGLLTSVVGRWNDGKMRVSCSSFEAMPSYGL